MREQSPTAKKIRLSNHPRNFGCRVTVHPPVCAALREMSHYLASVGACNLILYICRNRVPTVATYSCHMVSILIGIAITRETP